MSEELLPMLKQMPGSFYFDIDKYGLRAIGTGIDKVKPKNAYYNPTENLIAISNSLTESLSIFIHEFGHYKIKHLKLVEDEDLFKTFQKEREAFLRNQTAYENYEISYLTSASDKKGLIGSLEEMMCDVHSLMYSSTSFSEIEMRIQYLQEHFPETYAKIVPKFIELK